MQILGQTVISADCRIPSFSVISNSRIANNVTIRPGCVIDQSHIAARAVLGPYSHLRPVSEIGEGAHVGNFVETKKARLGRGANANHLTYLRYAVRATGANIGSCTMPSNYDSY